jgi:hypothetical protein
VRTHHEGVYEDVVVLEGVECRRGGDSVLASLAELEPRHDGGEQAEHRVVEHLHGRPRPEQRDGGMDRLDRCGGWQRGEVLRFIRALVLGIPGRAAGVGSGGACRASCAECGAVFAREDSSSGSGVATPQCEFECACAKSLARPHLPFGRVGGAAPHRTAHRCCCR